MGINLPSVGYLKRRYHWIPTVKLPRVWQAYAVKRLWLARMHKSRLRHHCIHLDLGKIDRIKKAAV